MKSAAPAKNPRKRPKGDKRARTRAALLAAAREVIREKGYEHTTMQAVAKRAGMTSGAIYGNFKNREELFMAMAEAFWPPIVPQFPAGSTFAEKMHAFAVATLAALPERRVSAVGALTGRAYALTHKDIQKRVHEVTARAYIEGAAWLRSVADEKDMVMPAEQMVRVVHVLTEGLVMQRLLTPDLVPDEVFHAAFAALAVKRKP